MPRLEFEHRFEALEPALEFLAGRCTAEGYTASIVCSRIADGEGACRRDQYPCCRATVVASFARQGTGRCDLIARPAKASRAIALRAWAKPCLLSMSEAITPHSIHRETSSILKATGVDAVDRIAASNLGPNLSGGTMCPTRSAGATLFKRLPTSTHPGGARAAIVSGGSGTRKP